MSIEMGNHSSISAGRDINLKVNLGERVVTIPGNWVEEAVASMYADSLNARDREAVFREIDRMEAELKYDKPDLLQVEQALNFIKGIAPSVAAVIVSLMPFLAGG